MIEEFILGNWADILFSVGSVIGIYSKGYQLVDADTVISRSSSLPNAVTYPITAIIPLVAEGMVISAFTVGISWVIWCGLYWFRSPDGEDWLGRAESS